jgi:NDP-sugar pyrophosphorylase family protein
MNLSSAVVLAGGEGERLKPLTENLPKGMIEICGKPLLQWIVEWLRDNKIKQVVLGVAYMRENIINYFGDGSDFDVDIRYSVHTVEGGTAEGFRLAINRYISQDAFFAMNGDQISDLNLDDLAGFHIKHNSVATMAVTSPHCPYGHVRTNDKHEAVDFLEKPLCPRAVCNAGIYVFNREILRYLPERGDVEKTTFSSLSKIHQLNVYPFNGFFITVNTHKDLIEAEEVLRRK